MANRKFTKPRPAKRPRPAKPFPTLPGLDPALDLEAPLDSVTFREILEIQRTRLMAADDILESIEKNMDPQAWPPPRGILYVLIQARQYINRSIQCLDSAVLSRRRLH